MKRLIFLVLFFYNLQILKATTYYVDNNSGNDSNNGLSKSNAWQTLNKVNSFSFLPNDSILFACGDVWRGQLLPKSGSSLGNITYASYGMGAKPQLLGSVDVSNLSNWINIGGNIWQSIQASSVDVGNLICNGGALCGKKKWTAASLLSQGDFWWDKNGTHKVEMYSATNPGLYYTDIEAALGNFIVYMSADSFVVLQNMALKYGAADGIEIRNTHHASILDCELSYIGGTELTTQVRYGGGIQFWAKSHDNRVERCKLWEIYDDALTNQANTSAGGTIQQYNIFYFNNIIWNCSESSFCFFIQPATVNGSYMKNIYFENNTCVNAGGGWGASQRPDLKGFQIYCSQITAPLDSIFIRNNIFYKSRCVLFIDNTTVPTWSYTTSDYNCWYTQNSTDTIAAFWKSNMITTYSGTQFLTYQNSTSQDVHSFMTDPLFINSNLPDYHLTAASPCINTGANTGINTDFDLVPRPQNNLYDIGAYEFGSLTELKKTDNDFAVKIFPNPSKGIFQLDLVGVDVAEVKVCDINGKVVFIQPKQSNNNLFGNKINIDVSQLPQGIYYVCIISNTDVINEKLVLVK